MGQHFLPDQLIQRCAERAAGYDRDNRFFHEDLVDLREAGYLLASVPREFGGLGMPFNQVCHEQRRLARGPSADGTGSQHAHWCHGRCRRSLPEGRPVAGVDLRRKHGKERFLASSLSGVGRNVLPLLVCLTLPTW